MLKMASYREDERALMLQSNTHYLSYLLTTSFDDLQEAARCAQNVHDDVLSNAPSDQRVTVQWTLARSLVRRFLHTRQVEDVTNAIEMFGNALLLMANANPARQTCFKYLIFSYLVKENKLEGSIELDDLYVRLPLTRKYGSSLNSKWGEEDEVVSENFLIDLTDLYKYNPSTSGVRMKIETLVPKLGEDEEVYKYFLSKLRILNNERFPSGHSLQEIDFQTGFLRQALQVFSSPPCDPRKISAILVLLGTLLIHGYSQQYIPEKIDEAVTCFCLALELPMKPNIAVETFFSASTAFRYRARGRREDLDTAVSYAEEGLAICDSQDDRFASWLDILAEALVTRYAATSNVEDLNTAIRTKLRAVNIAEQNDVEGLPSLLSRLAVCLHLRYTITGESEDLRNAVDISQRAVDLCSRNDPIRVHYLLALGRFETMLGGVQHDKECVGRGIRHLEEARSAKAEAEIFGVSFDYDFHMTIGQHLRYMRRWDESINMMRMMVSRVPNRDMGAGYRFLCLSLLHKYEATHERAILDEAIEAARNSIELEDSKADNLLADRILLAKCLHQCYKSTGDKEDLKNALAIQLEGFEMSTCTPKHRITAGISAINILCDLAEWDRAYTLAQKIVNLIVIVNGRFLDSTDKQYLLQFISEQISIYASIALQAGRDVFDVIDLLETCRGSILGQMLDNRTDFDDLKQKAPALAECFAALRDEVNGEVNLMGNMNARVEKISRRGIAEVEIRACLKEIRKLEGFDRFLLGPALGELKSAAAQGPILIVNVTSIRSDAIIVTEDAPVLLPLPELLYEKVAEYQEAGPIDFSTFKAVCGGNERYLRLLRWLWEDCVKLIFQKLDDLAPGTGKPHVWWMGIGIASSLPFHAAGLYTEKVRESALSRAISSYTPTLKVLLHGRRKLKSDHPDPHMQQLPSKPRMLIVTMPSTPGAFDLIGVQEEAEKVQKIVRGIYSAQHIVQPSAKKVMEHMEKYQVLHFACHGESILMRPLSSHLLLQTTSPDSMVPTLDKLTVGDVATLNLSQGKLAFLSACSTAENRYERLSDEALHLAAGFQVAGYLHTVGNLWPADDDVSVQVVERFYHHLLEAGKLGNGENVAKALNDALTDVLETRARQPLTWAQYVHFGV